MNISVFILELVATEKYLIIYNNKIHQQEFDDAQVCFILLPKINGNDFTTESNITISVDCLDYLGGTRDAAFVRVHSIPHSCSTCSGERWQSHVIIDAVQDGVSFGKEYL